MIEEQLIRIGMAEFVKFAVFGPIVALAAWAVTFRIPDPGKRDRQRLIVLTIMMVIAVWLSPVYQIDYSSPDVALQLARAKGGTYGFYCIFAWWIGCLGARIITQIKGWIFKDTEQTVPRIFTKRRGSPSLK